MLIKITAIVIVETTSITDKFASTSVKKLLCGTGNNIDRLWLWDEVERKNLHKEITVEIL